MKSTYSNMTLENGLGVLRDLVVKYLDRASYSQGTAILLGICWIISLLSGNKSPIVPGAKFHGYSSWFEPSFLIKICFVTNASNIIESGYKKFKNIPFVVRRYDTDTTVLPIKYLDEMRLIPRHKLNGKKAK